MKKTAVLIVALGLVSGNAWAESPTGGYELRLQTASQSAPPPFGILTAPGVSYATDAEFLSVNLLGGVGFVLSSKVTAGADLGVILLDPDQGDSVTSLSLSAFVKYVSNLGQRGFGFFAEPSLSLSTTDLGDESIEILTITVWGGAHGHVTDSVALVVGPYLSYLKLLEDTADDDEVMVGIRFGLSAYVLQ